MNRRNFITSIIVSCVAPTILINSSFKWKKDSLSGLILPAHQVLLPYQMLMLASPIDIHYRYHKTGKDDFLKEENDKFTNFRRMSYDPYQEKVVL